jgi:hypothetical protein
VPELVVQDGAERRAERTVAEAVPHVEILAHAVYLDRLEHEMDGRGAEQPARHHEEPELDAPRDVEAVDAQAVQVLPEAEVPSLDGDELLEDAAQVGRCH